MRSSISRNREIVRIQYIFVAVQDRLTSIIPIIMSAHIGREVQLTCEPLNHVLSNDGVWDLTSSYVVFDERSDPVGAVFDGRRIRAVAVKKQINGTSKYKTIYEAKQDEGNVGVALHAPCTNKVAFIQGPANTDEYAAHNRFGKIVDTENVLGNARRAPQAAPPPQVLDARDVVAPYTPGALRGGTHVHQFHPTNPSLVSSTYEDHVLTLNANSGVQPTERNARGVAVTDLRRKVQVITDHPLNHDGAGYTVLATRLDDDISSDGITRAVEEAWIGKNGYRHLDGSWQRHALAFLGEVASSKTMDVYVLDVDSVLPEDDKVDVPGTPTTRPRPPSGISRQRRITNMSAFGGVVTTPRHWPRSRPQGDMIAFLAKDERGTVQLYGIAPTATPNDPPAQLTREAAGVASAFSWSPSGDEIAFVRGDGCICVLDIRSRGVRVLTLPRRLVKEAPRPESCVFSPNGRYIAYVRRLDYDGKAYNQVFVVTVPPRRSSRGSVHLGVLSKVLVGLGGLFITAMRFNSSRRR